MRCPSLLLALLAGCTSVPLAESTATLSKGEFGASAGTSVATSTPHLFFDIVPHASLRAGIGGETEARLRLSFFSVLLGINALWLTTCLVGLVSVGRAGVAAVAMGAGYWWTG